MGNLAPRGGFACFLATAILAPLAAQTEVRLRLAAGAAAGEPRLALHTALAAETAARGLDAVLPSPGQAAGGAPFVAANLFDAADKARVGLAAVTLVVAGTRIRVTGAVDPARAGAGRVADAPAARLREVLAGNDAQLVVVLTDLERAAGLQLLRDVPDVTLVLQRAGALADRTPAEVDGRFVVPLPDDDAPRRLVATLANGKLRAPSLELLPPDAPAALADARQLLRDARPPPAATPARAATSRAVALQVFAARGQPAYGSHAAPCLVVDAQFTNVLPLAFVYDRKVPVAWQLPNLADHVYAVVDGRTVLRLAAGAETLPGHLQARNFTLARLGEHKRGNLVFSLPEGFVLGDDAALELRVYDFAHGHLRVALGGSPVAAAEPLGAVAKNEVVEAAVFGWSRHGSLGGETAPAGTTFVVVDLRARSTFTLDGDATAFDPKARTGQRLAIGTVADWTDAERYLQLVVDGEIACAPRFRGLARPLPLPPRFLPDLMTGGEIAFLAPTAAKSLALRCDFPNAKSARDGKLLRPKGLVLALEGTAAPPAGGQPLAHAGDSQFEVQVVSQERVPRFADMMAAEGETFLVLRCAVRNVGKEGEFFQTPQQLQLATADGALHPIDEVAGRGVAPPLARLWIPAGERRRFEAVWRLPPDTRRLRVMYASVDAGGASAMALPDPVDATSPKPDPGKTEQPKPEPTKPEPTKPELTKPEPTGPVVPQPAPVKPKPLPQPAKEARDRTVEVGAPQVPKGLAGVGLTTEAVNRAIDRGAQALWKHVVEQDLHGRVGNFGSHREHVLAALAMVHADLHRKVPAVDQALRRMLGAAEPMQGDMYDCGLWAMLVEAYGDPAFLAVQHAAVRNILETQGEDGSWTYRRAYPQEGLPGAEAKSPLRVTGGVPMAGEGPAPLARTTPWDSGQSGDNSTSQYALLGLLAAERSGIPIAREAWKRNAAAIRDRQCADGSWCYYGSTDSGYGSMTCAGICALAIDLHGLGVVSPGEDPALLRGLDWIDRHFAVDKHIGDHDPNQWHYYYLYALERTGRILDREFLGRHEWYPQGARWLIDAQGADGLWKGRGNEADPRLATSFALLFLTRATAPLAAKDLPRGGKGLLKTGVRPPRGGRYYVILDASGSMLDAMGGARKWDVAVAALSGLIEHMVEDSEVALRVYGHRKAALDDDASEDTELVRPMARLDRENLKTKLGALRARGKTPLALSLRQARRDLSAASATEPVTLVLLTDGGEDSLPRQDPVAAAAGLAELTQGPKPAVKFHVIGFDIGRDDWSQQLRAMAAAGGGAFWPAPRAENLVRSLQAAVLGMPESFALTDDAGAACGRGLFGDTLKLAEGRYDLTALFAGRRFTTPLWINTDRTTAVTFDAGAVLPEAGVQAGGPPPAVTPALPSELPTKDPPAQPKFCTACGKPLAGAAKFCASCGAKVKND